MVAMAPLKAARCNGVHTLRELFPDCSRVSSFQCPSTGSPSSFIKSQVAATWPCCAARCKGVIPPVSSCGNEELLVCRGRRLVFFVLSKARVRAVTSPNSAAVNEDKDHVTFLQGQDRFPVLVVVLFVDDDMMVSYYNFFCARVVLLKLEF